MQPPAIQKNKIHFKAIDKITKKILDVKALVYDEKGKLIIYTRSGSNEFNAHTLSSVSLITNIE